MADTTPPLPTTKLRASERDERALETRLRDVSKRVNELAGILAGSDSLNLQAEVHAIAEQLKTLIGTLSDNDAEHDAAEAKLRDDLTDTLQTIGGQGEEIARLVEYRFESRHRTQELEARVDAISPEAIQAKVAEQDGKLTELKDAANLMAEGLDLHDGQLAGVEEKVAAVQQQLAELNIDSKLLIIHQALADAGEQLTRLVAQTEANTAAITSLQTMVEENIYAIQNLQSRVSSLEAADEPDEPEEPEPEWTLPAVSSSSYLHSAPHGMPVPDGVTVMPTIGIGPHLDEATLDYNEELFVAPFVGTVPLNDFTGPILIDAEGATLEEVAANMARARERYPLAKLGCLCHPPLWDTANSDFHVRHLRRDSEPLTVNKGKPVMDLLWIRTTTEQTPPVARRGAEELHHDALLTFLASNAVCIFTLESTDYLNWYKDLATYPKLAEYAAEMNAAIARGETDVAYTHRWFKHVIDVVNAADAGDACPPDFAPV